jgi:hypothetical protein
LIPGLLPQDAAHGIVDARHRHASLGDERFEISWRLFGGRRDKVARKEQ